MCYHSVTRRVILRWFAIALHCRVSSCPCHGTPGLPWLPYPASKQCFSYRTVNANRQRQGSSIVMQNGCGCITCQSSGRYRATVALLLTTILVLVMSSAFLSPATFRYHLARPRPPDWLNGSAVLDVEPTGLVVDTPSCQIPDFDAYNPGISPYIRDPNPQFIVCNHTLPIIFTDGQYIRLNATLIKYLRIRHCLYQQVRSILYKMTHLLKYSYILHIMMLLVITFFISVGILAVFVCMYVLLHVYIS